MSIPAIYIQQEPGDNFTNKVVPISNGANYVVSSNFNNRNSFKYVADIYVEGTKVARLKHNCNITAGDRGIFDVSRVVENYINTDTQFLNDYGNRYTTAQWVSNIDAAKKFSVKFGCEFDRTFEIDGATNSGGKTFLKFKLIGTTTPNLVMGGSNFFYVSNSNITQFLGTVNALAVSSTGILTDKPWNASYSTIKATAIEGCYFYDNYGWTDPATGVFMIGFIVKTNLYTNFNLGDTLYIVQSAGATNPGYDGEAKCMGTQNVVLGGINYILVKTNKKFIASTPAQGGLIYSTDKYRFSELQTSIDSYGFDGGIDYLDYNSYTPLTYRMTNTNTGKFLTNKPDRKFKVPPTNKSLSLSLLGSSIMGSTFDRIRIQYYTSSNSLLGSFTFSSANNYLRSEVLVSPQQLATLNTLFNTHLNNGNMSYYKVSTENSSSQTCSEIITVTIDRECSRYDNYTLKFKNRLGGWDYFNFKGRKDKKVNIERSSFRKKLNRWNSTTSDWGYYVGDRGLNTFNVKATDQYVVNTGFLNTYEAEWLEELFTSPDVYWVDDTTSSEIPITLTQTDITLGTKKNIGLINYVVEFQKSYNKTIQRR